MTRGKLPLVDLWIQNAITIRRLSPLVNNEKFGAEETDAKDVAAPLLSYRSLDGQVCSCGIRAGWWVAFTCFCSVLGFKGGGAITLWKASVRPLTEYKTRVEELRLA